MLSNLHILDIISCSSIGISFQTGLNLESIHVNFTRKCVMHEPCRATSQYMYVEFYISDYFE